MSHIYIYFVRLFFNCKQYSKFSYRKILNFKYFRYQKKCDELEVANGQFQEKFEQMAKDKKEIVAFWKKQVEQRSKSFIKMQFHFIVLIQFSL